MKKLLTTKAMWLTTLIIFTMYQYANTQFQPDMPLSEANASFIGTAAGDECGSVIFSAGDVNGDGYDDFLITSWKNDEGGTDAGQAYLLLGNSSIEWGMDFNPSQADASFIGEAANDRAGTFAKGIGDINGDGFGDFMIGTADNDEGGENAGQSYLFLGRESADWGMDLSLSEADASFIGEAAGDRLRNISPAGDVNGDGIDDFLVSAHSNNAGSENAGKVYLFLGDTAAPWVMDMDPSSAVASFIGEAANDGAGIDESAITAGDVNGDGLDDFLIGTIWNDEGGNKAGQVYLILGDTATSWGMNFSLSQADASFIGEAAGDEAGYVQAPAGDLNNDGFDDFLIGANLNDEGGTDAGQCYLILGREAADWGMDYILSQADASFLGEFLGDHLGWVSYGGDVNGDGFLDILLGAKWTTYRGEAYLLLGNGEADWGMDYQLSSTDYSFIGEAAGDIAGFPVESAGDVNGDGLDDILIGAFGNDEGGTDAGQGYLFLGDIAISVDQTKDFNQIQIFPNPFTHKATISYQLTHERNVTLEIYTLAGQKLNTIVSEVRLPGIYEVEWDASAYKNGIYYCKLTTGAHTQIKKMILMR